MLLRPITALQPTARLYALERLVPAFHSVPELAPFLSVLEEQMALLKLQMAIDVRTHKRGAPSVSRLRFASSCLLAAYF